MGKEVQKKAQKLGLTNLPKFTFYGRPKKLKMKFSKIEPDIAYTVENCMKNVDPSFEMEESSKLSNIRSNFSYNIGLGKVGNSYYYIAPQKSVYVEIYNQLAGFAGWVPDNYVCQIDIYTNDEDHVRAITKDINALWDDGIIPHLDFKKLEKKYKVKREDVINAWNAFL